MEQVPTLSRSQKARFWSKVSRDVDVCWLWAGTVNNTGYGRFWLTGRYWQAHRVAYTLACGPIADGLMVDHICRNRQCVKPAHLEAVSPRTNTLRGDSPTALNARKGVCVNGHVLAEENLVQPVSDTRRCLACHRARSREGNRRYRARRKAARGSAGL
ncbi:hypothetical protein GCM10010298_34560 [Streptomyces microflavus]|uniref:HNH nuclease domain-containing protein n=1 Tax=Streptomyces microflavus TaxID=1919 RepID=A0A7J0D4G9_STRMI|nr:hypothetical protein Smic_81440 [Streptomyces microflavus]GGX66943.1 hypothetical protein GCM10010298_34560 [Streptomyces microflavus]